MGRKKSAKLIVVLDASGSMSPRKDETISSFNEYMKSLKKTNLSYKVTAFSFNTAVKTIFSEVSPDDAELSVKNYVTEGYTALLDALGRAVSGASDDKKTPFLVVVFTDGQENASKEFNKNTIFKLLEQKTEQGNWTFVYMGSDPSTWGEAMSIGIPKGSTMSYDQNDPRAAVRALTACTDRYASVVSASVGNTGPVADFFDNPSFPTSK